MKVALSSWSHSSILKGEEGSPLSEFCLAQPCVAGYCQCYWITWRLRPDRMQKRRGGKRTMGIPFLTPQISFLLNLYQFVHIQVSACHLRGYWSEKKKKINSQLVVGLWIFRVLQWADHDSGQVLLLSLVGNKGGNVFYSISPGNGTLNLILNFTDVRQLPHSLCLIFWSSSGFVSVGCGLHWVLREPHNLWFFAWLYTWKIIFTNKRLLLESSKEYFYVHVLLPGPWGPGLQPGPKLEVLPSCLEHNLHPLQS